jgi:hypothetical protein
LPKDCSVGGILHPHCDKNASHTASQTIKKGYRITITL